MNKSYIKKQLPEISSIKKKSIQQGVINSWLLAMKRGGWKDLKRIPFTLLIKTKHELIEHTRIVTRMAMAIANERTDVDMDCIIAGGLVHDVGKLIEYTRMGRRIVKSKMGILVRHPVSGYALVLEAGLPPAIAHIVAAHSVEGEKVKRSPEAIIIHHCDFIDFEIAKSR